MEDLLPEKNICTAMEELDNRRITQEREIRKRIDKNKKV